MTQDLHALPRGHYRVILADPPWMFAAGTSGRPQHYGRMTDRELARLPVEDLAHPDGCWLFLWTTSPKIFHAQRIAEAWGFRYSGRAFVWVKTTPDGLHMGQGYTTRKNAEDCLLFRRGAPKRTAKDVHEVIISPVREHSRKPDEAYGRIERFAAGPYLELFARQEHLGWTAWGDQVGRFSLPMLEAAE